MNQQLADLGIRWVHVPYIDNPATGCYEITLELDANTTNSERSIAFGNLLVRQSGENFYPAVGWPTDHCYYICPGQSAEIQLYDTVLDENYYVWRTYEDDIDEEIDFFTGTGGNYTYYLSTLGTYRFDFPNSDFTIKYYEAFDYVYDAGEEILSVDPNGGIYRYSLTKYWKDGIMYPVYDLNDVAFFDAPFAIYNSGGSTCWDAHMQISYGYDDDSGRLYLEIYCPPNLSESAISNQTNLRFDDDMAMEVYQPEGGAVLSLPVIYKFHEATSRFVAYIDSSQPDVVYTLYRDGVEQSTTLGNGKEIALFAPNVAGYYHVMATYEMNGITDSAELNGARYDSGHILALDENSSWILTKTFQNENSGTLDVTYYNGLGLPEQTVQVQASPNGQDIILPIDYDIALRDDAKNYLPYVAVSSDGRKQVSPFTDQQEFYKRLYGTADSERSFTEKLYEASPLNRVLKQALPGYVKDHEVVYTEFNYRTNTANEVRRLAIGVNDELICGGYYDAGMLACTVSTAPDDHIVQNFTDKRGLTLLNRTFDDDEPINTYFVYDDYDRLQWVITPEGSCRFGDMQTVPKDDKFAKDYCYVYTYNDRGLMVEKRMPGREAEYMRYDEGDRLRVSQDGNLRAKKQWISYSYDALGRVQEQSLAVEAELIPIRSQAGVSIGEPIKSVEPPYLSSSVPLRKYVYDTYPSEVQAAGLDFQPIEGLTATDGESLRYDNATGSLTYEKLAVLANDTITGYHQRACYYDYKGRVIQTVERDTEDGILCTSQRYDFVGNLIAQRESYTRAGKTDDIDRTFTYDDRGRLLSETTQVNGGEEAVVYYEYDELGRLAARRLGEGTSAIAEQSEYDIRSWLTAKSSELFDMSLGHSYTGNITSWQWQHKGDPSGDGPQNRYEFTYDDLSRLTNTDQYVNGELNKQNVERFLTYDRNGNLLTLIRYADGVQSSNRQYTYIGNRLDRMEKDRVIAWDEIEIHPGGPAIVVPEKVTEDNGTAALDAGISIDTSAVIRPVDPGIILHSRYAHDRNGNLTYDMELQTNFAYNSLNLLEKAMRNDTIVAKYSYLADGTKLSAVNADDCGFAYRGSFTYRMDAEADRVFESTPFGGGRIVATAGNDTEIRYFLTDHLESVRVVATDQNNVLERNDYYPFGKRWNSASLPISDNRDHFNGKEDQVFIGDCLADYGARCYNKLNGRWLSQDPLQQYHSPYVFCGNNPIRLIDLDGMEARDSTSVMIPPVIVYPSEDGEGGGHSNSFWWSLIPGYSLYEAYEAFSDGEYKSGFKNGLYGTIDIGLCFIPVSKLSNLYKVGKNLKKATSISRILPQFSNSTIERAVQKMMRNKDKIDFHIFVPKHKLENVVNTLGGKENTIRQALIELNGKLPVSGKFEATIELGGSQVTVRGYVVDGLPDIGTMFVPK